MLLGTCAARFGRFRAIVLSQLAIVAGLVLSALFVRSGFWILTVLDALVAAGWTGHLHADLRRRLRGVSAESQRPERRNLRPHDQRSPAIGIAVYSTLMDQNGFASKAFLRAGRAAAGQRNAAADLLAVEASNMFWVMAAVAAVTLLVILCARAAIRSTENQPAEVEKEAEERVLERGNR